MSYNQVRPYLLRRLQWGYNLIIIGCGVNNLRNGLGGSSSCFKISSCSTVFRGRLAVMWDVRVVCLLNIRILRVNSPTTASASLTRWWRTDSWRSSSATITFQRWSSRGTPSTSSSRIRASSSRRTWSGRLSTASRATPSSWTSSSMWSRAKVGCTYCWTESCEKSLFHCIL